MTIRILLTVVALLSLVSTASATPELYVPWPCNQTYTISQGHNTGSHTGQGGWAWDIGIGVNQDVVAPANGTVRMIRMDSNSHGCSSAYANDANYVVLDFGDGTEALFLHLQANSSNLKVGDNVVRGQVVGKVGLSGWVCGAHLHFQVQTTCSSWWCTSIPSQFEGFGDPAYGTPITSNNCGNIPPPQDCEARLSGGTTRIDEDDAACFQKETQWWWDGTAGTGGRHFYTYATDAAAVDTRGTWRFGVDVPGNYRVEVHVPSSEAEARNAVYRVNTGNGTAVSRAVNQNNEKGWVPLGTWSFAAGDDRFVRLNDNTGESYDLRRKLAYDSIRLVWDETTPPPPMDDPPDMTADTISGDMGVVDMWTAGDDMRSGADGFTVTDVYTADANMGSDGYTGGNLDGDFGADGDPNAHANSSMTNVEGGCACRVRTGGVGTSKPLGAGLVALTLLGLVAVVRRRRD